MMGDYGADGGVFITSQQQQVKTKSEFSLQSTRAMGEISLQKNLLHLRRLGCARDIIQRTLINTA